MSDTIDINKNVHLQEWPWFTTEELENDSFLLTADNKENDSSNAAFIREIEEAADFLKDSVDPSTPTNVDKSPPLSTVMSTGTKKVFDDLKKRPSIPPITTASAVTAAVEAFEPETPRAASEAKSPASSLRRSNRPSTQKKTRATEERLQQRSSSASASVATPKMSNDITKFLSPEFESIMAQSALSNSLSENRLFEAKLYSLVTSPLIPTPYTLIPSSLDPFAFTPGLDEWAQLYLSRPKKGNQYAIWKWLDSARSTAFRFPVSIVKQDKSCLDIWTKAPTISSSPSDTNVPLADVFTDEVCNAIAAGILDEPSGVPAEKESGDGKKVNENKSPEKTSDPKSSDDLSPMKLQVAGEYGAAEAHGKETENSSVAPNASQDAIASPPTASAKALCSEKVVSFHDLFSPPLKFEKARLYRKTPHVKVSQPIPDTTPSLHSDAPDHITGNHRHESNTPFGKTHYPTTPYGCDSPSTDVPYSWIQLFLDRPDPFESSTKEVLSWLGEVADIIENNGNVKIPTIALATMPTVSSMNDTPMVRKSHVMSPTLSPMMGTSVASPLYEDSNDE